MFLILILFFFLFVISIIVMFCNGCENDKIRKDNEKRRAEYKKANNGEEPGWWTNPNHHRDLF